MKDNNTLTASPQESSRRLKKEAKKEANQINFLNFHANHDELNEMRTKILDFGITDDSLQEYFAADNSPDKSNYKHFLSQDVYDTLQFWKERSPGIDTRMVSLYYMDKQYYSSCYTQNHDKNHSSIEYTPNSKFAEFISKESRNLITSNSVNSASFLNCYSRYNNQYPITDIENLKKQKKEEDEQLKKDNEKIQEATKELHAFHGMDQEYKNACSRFYKLQAPFFAETKALLLQYELFFA